MLDSTGGSSSDQPEGTAADQREQSKTDQPDKETSDQFTDDQPGTDMDNSAAQPDKKDLEGTTCDQPDEKKPLEEDAKPDVEEPMAKKQKVGRAVA